MKKKKFLIIAGIVIFVIVLIILFVSGSSNDNSKSKKADSENSSAYSENSDGEEIEKSVEEISSEKVTLAKKILVANKLSGGSTNQSSKATAESLIHYTQGKLSCDEPDKNSAKRYVAFTFKGEVSDIPQIKAYVKMLSENGFAVVDTYEDSYSETFYSCALNWRNGTLNGKTEMNYVDGIYGDITIYICTDRGSMRGGIFYSEDIQFVDTGYRYGEKQKDMSYTGASARAGLYMQGNHFSTDDGRLSTDLGKADIICDGTKYSVNAMCKKQSDRNAVFFATETFNGDNAIGFVIPDNHIKSNTIYANEQLESGEAYFGLLCDYPHKDMLEAMSVSNWTLGFGVNHNNKYMCPCSTIDTGIKKTFLRVMYIKENKVAVCYAAAEFDTAPYKVEILAAFNLYSMNSENVNYGNGGGGGVPTANSSNGKQKCGNCNGEGKVKCFQCHDGKVDCPYCADGYDYDLVNNTKIYCNRCVNGTQTCANCNGCGKKDCPFCVDGYK